MRPYPTLLYTNGKVVPKLGVGAPKFGIGHLIFKFFLKQVCRYLFTLTFKSYKTNCILIATAMPFD